MSEVEALRRLVEDLALRVVAIEQGFVVDHARYRMLGFTPSEAIVVALLMRREYVSRDGVLAVLYGAAPDDLPEVRIVDVFMHRIRRKLRLRGLALQTVLRVGWVLAPQTKAAIERWITNTQAAAE
jgi:DNA-binding response OmpR family regulator